MQGVTYTYKMYKHDWYKLSSIQVHVHLEDRTINADWQSARIGLIAAFFSFCAGLLALNIMMKMLKSISYTPYVVYRIILGIIILWISYT